MTTKSKYLVRGETQSCGCLSAQITSAVKSTHGRSKTREYETWNGIKGRCLNPRDEAYPSYGGRGITICPEWRDSFEAFFSHVGPCPPGLTIDRIDNSRGYEPGNVRWASKREQANNTRRNRRFTHDGKTLTLTEWAQIVGIKRLILLKRIKRGWSIVKTLTAPVRNRPRRHLVLHPEGREDVLLPGDGLLELD